MRFPVPVTALLLFAHVGWAQSTVAPDLLSWDNAVVAVASQGDAPSFDALASDIERGRYADLGATVLQLPAPWMHERGGVSDFTRLDPAFGTRDGLHRLVGAARKAGLKVVVEVNLNRASPPKPDDTDSTAAWGPGWIRASATGFDPCGADEVTSCLGGTADFITEIGTPVELPPGLLRAWTDEHAATESRALDDFFVRTKYPRMPRYFMIKWLADWVREFGFDGFFVHDASRVDVGLWPTLKTELLYARADWAVRAGNPQSQAPEFWLGGDATPGSEASAEMLRGGFNALVLPVDADNLDGVSTMDSLFHARADAMAADASYRVVSPVTAEMLTPSGTAHTSGAASSPESPSTFSTMASAIARSLTVPGALVLTPGAAAVASNEALWKTVADFRRRHVAVGAGMHSTLSTQPYTFHRAFRYGSKADDVVVVMGATDRVRVNVSAAFADDSIVRDAVTGSTAFVSFGYVSFEPDASGLLLLESGE